MRLPTEDIRVKYQARNPIVRSMVKGFLNSFDQLFTGLDVKKILEVGCGEGFLSNRMSSIKPSATVIGLDYSMDILEIASQTFTNMPRCRASVYNLPFKDNFFDLTVACEVLEHLEEPHIALPEIQRVTKKYFLASVPQEPLWRILNFMRGKYITTLGNYPGHIQHWTPGEFVKLVSGYFDVCEIVRPFPWTMIIASRRNSLHNQIGRLSEST